MYTEADVHGLEFIRQVKALGLTLNEVQELMRATRERTCAMTRPLLLRVLDRRLSDTALQIETLTRLTKTLRRARRALARRPPTDHRLGYCSCLSSNRSVINEIRRKEKAGTRTTA